MVGPLIINQSPLDQIAIKTHWPDEAADYQISSTKLSLAVCDTRVWNFYDSLDIFSWLLFLTMGGKLWKNRGNIFM